MSGKKGHFQLDLFYSMLILSNLACELKKHDLFLHTITTNAENRSSASDVDRFIVSGHYTHRKICTAFKCFILLCLCSFISYILFLKIQNLHFAVNYSAKNEIVKKN